MISLRDSVLQVLGDEPFDCDGRDIADIVWLACQLWTAGCAADRGAQEESDRQDAAPLRQPSRTAQSSSGLSLREIANAAGPKPDVLPAQPPQAPGRREVPRESSPAATIRSAEERVQVYLPGRKQGGPGVRGRTIHVPAADALPGKLAIARALRPLTRRIASRTAVAIDESETVFRVAESGLWDVVLRPAAERWYQVTLVVDGSISMAVWEETALQLRQTLQWTAAFRNVSLVWMNADSTDQHGRSQLLRESPRRARHRASPGAGTSAALPSRTVPPSLNLRVDDNHLIIVVSDFVSRAWQTEVAFEQLKGWSRRAVVVLAQVLPQPLWRRTALGNKLVSLRHRPGHVSNATFDIASTDPLEEDQSSPPGSIVPGDLDPSMRPDAAPPFRLPVMTLEPEAVAQLAGTLAQDASGWLSGVVLRETEGPGMALPAAERKPLSGTDRVRRFERWASPTARELAQKVAVLHPAVSFQTIRLIREKLVPRAGLLHEAELVLGGLIRQSTEPFAQFADTNDIFFAFHEGVVEELRKSTSFPERQEVLSKLSEYVEKRLGRSGAWFGAFLEDPDSPPSDMDDAGAPAFEFLLSSLDVLGGKFAQRARDVRMRFAEIAAAQREFRLKALEPAERAARRVDDEPAESSFDELAARLDASSVTQGLHEVPAGGIGQLAKGKPGAAVAWCDEVQKYAFESAQKLFNVELGEVKTLDMLIDRLVGRGRLSPILQANARFISTLAVTSRQAHDFPITSDEMLEVMRSLDRILDWHRVDIFPTSFRPAYAASLPLPLAQLYERTYDDTMLGSRHQNACSLFEALITLAGAVHIACYRDELRSGGQEHIRAIDEEILQLAAPTLGRYLSILRNLSRHYGKLRAGQGHPLSSVWEQLQRRWEDRPAMLALCRRMKGEVGGSGDRYKSCSILDVFMAFVSYRNAGFGHGVRLDSFYAEMEPLLLAAANELFAQGVFDFLGPQGSQLVCVSEIRTMDDRKVEVALGDLQGSRPAKTTLLLLERLQAQGLTPKQVGVLWPGRPGLLCLDPLLAVRDANADDCEVLFLNRANGRQAAYFSYTSHQTVFDVTPAKDLQRFFNLFGEQLQHSLSRVRRPRVQLTYDVEVVEGVVVKELPFVVGVMGDFTGNPTKPRQPLIDRKFVSIDRDNFNDVMAQLAPELNFRVPHMLKDDGSEFPVQLKFASIDDFEPARIVGQSAVLLPLLEAHNALQDLMDAVDKSQGLEKELEPILRPSDAGTTSINELRGSQVEATRFHSSTTRPTSDGEGITPESSAKQNIGLLATELTAGKVDMQAADASSDLIRRLGDLASRGVVIWDVSVFRTLGNVRDELDRALSLQLAAVMHHPDFLRLEGSWRGLSYLVMNSETSSLLKLRLLAVSKRELIKDLGRSIEFDYGPIFKKIYTEEYSSPGGEPYGAIIGDYEFTNHPEDIDLLQKIGTVAAAAFAPFIAAASPNLLGLSSYVELSRPRDLEKILLSKEHIKWNAFRDSDDSRFVCLTLPRALARLPYGAGTKRIEEFGYEEAELNETGGSRQLAHEHYCWMNAAYLMGARLTDAFARHGWCTAIRGVENGGMVEGLPMLVFRTDGGDLDLKCPTEIGISDRREAELSKLGLLPLCHNKNTDFSVFYSGQTCQRPKRYDSRDASANASIMTRLPVTMAVSRLAQYVKCIARDKLGSFSERHDMEAYLNGWIQRYVVVDANPTAEVRAAFPFAEAQIEVKDIPGRPGSFNAMLWLRPWLSLESLTASIRTVVPLPSKEGF
jgi:type VI secretion system protein ImpC